MLGSQFKGALHDSHRSQGTVALSTVTPCPQPRQQREVFVFSFASSQGLALLGWVFSLH